MERGVEDNGSGMSVISFEGNRQQAHIHLKTGAGRFYVYILCRPDGRPFYVGKGVNFRALEHEAEARRHHPFGESNPFKCNVIRKIIGDGGEVIYQVEPFFNIDQQLQCLEREAELIGQHKRLHEGGCLTNLAGGVGNLSGAAPFSLERHAATLSGEPENNPQRSTLNRFLAGIGSVDSVPIKPVSQISRILPSTPHPSKRSPTARAAYALIASAAANGLQLWDGVRIPRSFTYEGVAAVIENGVSRDLLKAGMATLMEAPDAANEAYVLNEAQIGVVAGLVGRQRLSDLGVM